MDAENLALPLGVVLTSQKLTPWFKSEFVFGYLKRDLKRKHCLIKGPPFLQNLANDQPELSNNELISLMTGQRKLWTGLRHSGACVCLWFSVCFLTIACPAIFSSWLGTTLGFRRSAFIGKMCFYNGQFCDNTQWPTLENNLWCVAFTKGIFCIKPVMQQKCWWIIMTQLGIWHECKRFSYTNFSLCWK